MAEKTDAVPTPEKAASFTTLGQSPEITGAFPVHCKLASTGAEILVNAEEKSVQFYRCHVPRKFFTLGGATDYVVCRFDEIEAYYVYAVRGKFGSTTPRFCKIVTTTGTATICEDAIGFKSLCSWLEENVASNSAAHPAEIPLFVARIAGVVTVFAVLVYGVWPSDSVLDNPKFIGMIVLLFVGFVLVWFFGLVRFSGGWKRRKQPIRTGRLPDERDV
jgi:hypothetical protein